MKAGYRCCILPLYHKAPSQSSPVKSTGKIVNVAVYDQQMNVITENTFVQLKVCISQARNKCLISYSSGNGTVDKISLT
jgi:hypothetical protein